MGRQPLPRVKAAGDRASRPRTQIETPAPSAPHGRSNHQPRLVVGAIHRRPRDEEVADGNYYPPGARQPGGPRGLPEVELFDVIEDPGETQNVEAEVGWMVDDLREIIYTQKRARYRTGRMIHRSGNMWSFMSAPKHVVNK